MNKLDEQLANLTTEEIETLILDLENEFLKIVKFCLGTYEELILEEQRIKELQNKIDLENELNELIFLKQELSEEKEHYIMLARTLGGSSGDPRTRLYYLNQCRSIASQRQGIDEEKINRSLVFDNKAFEDYCHLVYGNKD
jgi:hypothetical protein